jgi:hypothetical protein
VDLPQQGRSLAQCGPALRPPAGELPEPLKIIAAPAPMIRDTGPPQRGQERSGCSDMA